MFMIDLIAIGLFFGTWAAFVYLSDGGISRLPLSLSQAMDIHRRRWVEQALTRELRMIDTGIIAGLQNGTAFFASTCFLAIGGSFALLGATDQVEQVLSDLPFEISGGRQVFEMKVGGLAAIFAFSFFKFGWAYRLFNYASILIGAIPMPSQMEAAKGGLDDEAKLAVERAVDINILAGKHFNSGLRGIFFSIGYLGWFVGPLFFICTTALVLAVLIRRQYLSAARAAALKGLKRDPT